MNIRQHLADIRSALRAIEHELDARADAGFPDPSFASPEFARDAATLQTLASRLIAARSANHTCVTELATLAGISDSLPTLDAVIQFIDRVEHLRTLDTDLYVDYLRVLEACP